MSSPLFGDHAPKKDDDEEGETATEEGEEAMELSLLPSSRRQGEAGAAMATADDDAVGGATGGGDEGPLRALQAVKPLSSPRKGQPRRQQQSARGHRRSASHGAALLTTTPGEDDEDAGDAEGPDDVCNRIVEEPIDESKEDEVFEAVDKNVRSVKLQPLQSALKKPGGGRGHRRVFSHGQIPVQTMDDETGGARRGGLASGRGHRRTGSKTDFILPPGHEERERRRSVTRSGSHRSTTGPAVAEIPTGSAHARRGSSYHKRSDSLAFSFRGHSRQASRTDSIYTLRQSGPNYKRKVFFLGKKKKGEEADPKHRMIVPNHMIPSDVGVAEHPNRTYLNNYVRTTKYTLLSFLPKNLFEQFHRFANLYFLFIVLLNWVPAISAFGKEISMLPVIFVLAVTAIKDLFEDRRRYISDKRVNNLTCRVYRGSAGRYVKCLWKEVRVGDLVHLSCDEMIPADMLLLRSSDENGLCYIDTQNLDGETNLKQREVPRGFVEKQSTFKPQDFRSTIECDAPTTKIYRFHGSILHPWGERVPIGKDNLLLRDCVLKNTNYVEGLVVYAGHESKAMLNNGGPRYKRSKLERQINLEVIWCVVILLVLCFIGALGSGLWLNEYVDVFREVPFLTKTEENPAYEGFLTFWTFVIILQIIIPLSLYVTIEMAKLLQIYLIHQDGDMYDELCDKNVECRALNIPEELGQVQYVFCDKTGTLTENNMVFKRCTIDGADYDHNTGLLNKSGGDAVDSAKSGRRASLEPNPMLSHTLSLTTSQAAADFKRAHKVQEFFLLLAVCNTVIVAKQPHRDNMNASGFICSSVPSTASSARRRFKRKDTKVTIVPLNGGGDGGDNQQPGEEDSTRDEADGRAVQTPSPPPSLMSTSSSTAPLHAPQTQVDGAPVSSPPPSSALLRPSRLLPTDQLLFPCSSKPALSPIASSPEITPTTDQQMTREPSEQQQATMSHTAPPTPATSKSKILNLPSILNRLVSPTPNSSRTGTPLPTPSVDASKPLYEAESPDELALVDAAHAYDIRLLRRTPNKIVLSTPGDTIIDLEILHILPFDSVRKRMSVILLHPITKEKVLYCKGADSAMFPRLRAQLGQDLVTLDKTKEHLDSYAKLGLRVLVMAKRVIGDTEYAQWARQHAEAENALNRRERLLLDSHNRIESELTLLGTTGIEDKLQEGVPEAIHYLRQAGIVVWVLTGDKQETAVNIAHSCKLFSPGMELLKLNANSRDVAETIIRDHMKTIRAETLEKGAGDPKGASSSVTPLTKRTSGRALVVDGKTLVYILDKRANLQKPFLALASHCSSVLCCRATPLQKAYIVRIVKEELGQHTLAIGDGANDVSMIQTADVGVGISGQEGMQAVMASDFAISRFKYLERLLLVHGHWNYDRLARMVLYFFYKNAAFIFVCFWYELFCGFSGAVMIDQMYLMLYNLFFTSLPPMAIGIFDQDAPDVVLTAHPHLYKQGRLGEVYKPHSFWINMADALYQSVVIYFVAHLSYAGSDVGIWEFGTVICTECLVVMSLHLCIETKSWTIVHWVSILLSILLYFVFALIYNGVCVDCFGLNAPFWVMQHAMGDIHFWVICLLAAVAAVLPRVLVRTFRNTVLPDDVTRVILAGDTLRQQRTLEGQTYEKDAEVALNRYDKYEARTEQREALS